MSIMLDAILAQAANGDPTTVALSSESVAVLLFASYFLNNRVNWLDTAENPLDEVTDADWDEIEKLVANAMWDIMHPELGAIIPFATAAVPQNCLLCDGATYNRVDYPLLYDVLDPAFIIDSLSFQVPDLSEREVVGIGYTAPSELAADAFPCPTGTALETCNPAWGVTQGDYAIDTFGAIGNNATEINLAWYDLGVPWPADQYSQGTVLSLSGTGANNGVAVRVSTVGAMSAYYFVWDETQQFFYKMVDGDFDEFALIAEPLDVGDVIRIAVVGNQITVYRNGAVYLTQADNDLTTGAPGLTGFGYTPGLRVSEWSGGSMGEPDGYTMGETGGEKEITLTVEQMPEHTHTDVGHDHSYTQPGATIAVVTPGEIVATAPNLIPGVTGTGNADIQNTGGGQPHENRPPFMALRYCIRAQ